MPDGYQLRHVLEVWTTGDAAALLFRDEKIAAGGGSVNFDFKLADAGTYTALLWADFVKADAAASDREYSGGTFTHHEDFHYNTTGNLKNVTLADTGDAYTVNDDTRDAFTARVEIVKGVGVYRGDVTLGRALGQLNLVEKDAALLPVVTSVTLDYAVPGSFDVETGTPGGMVAVKTTLTTLPLSLIHI